MGRGETGKEKKKGSAVISGSGVEANKDLPATGLDMGIAAYSRRARTPIQVSAIGTTWVRQVSLSRQVMSMNLNRIILSCVES